MYTLRFLWVFHSVCLLTSAFFLMSLNAVLHSREKILRKNLFCLDQRCPTSGAAQCIDTRKAAQYLSAQKDTIPAFINTSIQWMSAVIRAVFLRMQQHSSVCMCEAVVQCSAFTFSELMTFFFKKICFSHEITLLLNSDFSEWTRRLPKVLLCFSE